MTEYVGVTVWADRYGVDHRTARRYAAKGQIPGARQVGRLWEVPADAIPPYTAPAHMRPASRTIPGEVVAGTEVAAAVRPRPAAAARYVPEAPLFYTFAQLAQMVDGVITPRVLSAMLAAGEITGYRRGRTTPGGRPAWVIPAAEVKRLRGD